VIERMFGCLASFSRSLPVMSTDAPLIEANTFFALPFSLAASDATELLFTPFVPWTMTLKTCAGFAWACASRAAGTTASPPLELTGAATPAAGSASAAAAARTLSRPLARSTRCRVPERPPLPQSAFPLEPPTLEVCFIR